MFLTVRYLLGGKHQVDQVAAQRTGQGLFQKRKILLRLVLGHGTQGFIQIGDDLPAGVDVASINPADSALVRAEPTAQLADFFLIHKNLGPFPNIKS